MTDAMKFYNDFIDLMKRHSNEIGPGQRDASMPLRAAAHCCGQAAAKSGDPPKALVAILEAFQNGFNANMALKATGQPDPEPVLEAAPPPVEHDLKDGDEYIHGATPMDNAFADAVGNLILHHSAMTNPDITMGLLGWTIGDAMQRMGCVHADIVKKAILTNLDMSFTGRQPEDRIN